jgi:tetratricopeptide (TPR) repeat protein
MCLHGAKWLVLLWLLGLAACDGGRSQAEYERQLGVCSVAEGNGLLEPAVEACSAALALAEQQGHAPDEVAGLLYRVGRLERQRGNFVPAEELLRRSLALAEAAGETSAVAARLIELAQILAGQDRWLDGLQLLERATPLLSELSAGERRAAANVFRGFGVRLGLQGHSTEAERCQAVARELAAAS